MKSVFFALVTMLAGMNAAHADAISLGLINADNCYQVESDLALLNSNVAGVIETSCAFGAFTGSSGITRPYQVTPTLVTYQPVGSGSHIRMNYIDTNDCTRFVNEIRLLQTPYVSVNVQCVGPGSFSSNSGNYYLYRIVTDLYLN